MTFPPEAWAAAFTAGSAVILAWLDHRDKRLDRHDEDDEAEIARLRARVADVEADRDRWRDRYYDCRGGIAPEQPKEKPEL